jgi:hypothetical protein
MIEYCQMNKKLGRRVLTGGVIILALLVIAFCVQRVSSERGANRNLVLKLATSIRLGDGKDKVENIIANNLSEKNKWTIRRNRESGMEYYSIASPLEFGATNWVLHVLVEESVVVAIGVRVEDSTKKKPANGPADRVDERVESMWIQNFVQQN